MRTKQGEQIASIVAGYCDLILRVRSLLLSSSLSLTLLLLLLMTY